MLRSVAAFCSWLELTAPSRMLQRIEWIVPAVQTVHILGIAAVMGATLFLNLRLLGLTGRDVPVSRVSARFVPVVWTALVILLLTGLVMIAAEPARSLLNPVFQLKMLLLLGAVTLTLLTARAIRGTPEGWAATRARWFAPASAIVSSALWVAILCAGRWIAYARVH
ncbi:MAG TPA: DUF6644 family protein [Myxococcaceae bacterium]|nr:DUF6644 family protein [Myxococcaceae bacterium]